MIFRKNRSPAFASDPSRMQLGFAQVVESNFDFLVKQFGYRIVYSQPTFVRYETKRTFVNIYHGRSSYELGVEIGYWIKVRGKVAERKFMLGEVVALDHDPIAVGYRDYSARDKESVARFIKQLADWTQQFGSKALNGDPATLDALKAQSARQSQALMDGWKASKLRKAANEAWHRKDWARLIDIYAELETEVKTIELKQSERARLSYARRKLKEMNP